MAEPTPPQFGTPEPGVSYRDRPAAFGVVEREGRIAVVKVTRPEAWWFDLPGGALDPGEDENQALEREFGEETGLIVAPGPLIVRAGQYFRLNDGELVNNRSAIFRARIVSENPDLKIEDDHELAWLDPVEAIERLRHDSHAWAVAKHLRGRLDRQGSGD